MISISDLPSDFLHRLQMMKEAMFTSKHDLHSDESNHPGDQVDKAKPDPDGDLVEELDEKDSLRYFSDDELGQLGFGEIIDDVDEDEDSDDESDEDFDDEDDGFDDDEDENIEDD